VTCAAAQAEAFEQGEQWFKAYPEALLVEVHWEATNRFNPNDPHMQIWAFVQGFTNARQRRDEYLQEQKQMKGNQS
jgi:hypothetical protein